MIAAIAWLAAKAGIPRSVVIALLILIAAAAAIGAWKLWLNDHDGEVVERHETKIEAKLEKQGRAADQNMIDRRDADLADQANGRKDFDNATAHLPKSGLTNRQRIDACRELREQGTDPAILARASCL